MSTFSPKQVEAWWKRLFARSIHERALHIVGGQCAQLGVAEHVVAERKDALEARRRQSERRGGCHREEAAGEAAHAGNLGAFERQK